jgi:hypothetical protein
MRAIIDTNVLIAANGRDCPQVTSQCESNTRQYLYDLQRKGTILIDNQRLILSEYMRKVNQTGEPGIGDRFLKWILRNQANIKHCEQVTIHSIFSPDNNEFEEFPNDPELEKFDRSDRKFVAVALASIDRPPIINAVDSDWLEFYEPLVKNGIKIQFLCPDVVTPP